MTNSIMQDDKRKKPRRGNKSAIARSRDGFGPAPDPAKPFLSAQCRAGIKHCLCASLRCICACHGRGAQ